MEHYRGRNNQRCFETIRVVFGLLFVLSISSVKGQSSIAVSLEKLLIEDHKKLSEAEPMERTDKGLITKFKLDMMHSLKHAITWEHPFDSLGQRVKIIKSSDNKVRIFSWDELTGGRWHDMSAVVQFWAKAADGSEKMLKTVIDMSNGWDRGDYNDRIFTHIFNYTNGDRTNYLLFGWGSHGSGTQYHTVEAYTIEGGSFVPLKGVFRSGSSNSDIISLECLRNQKVQLQYDSLNHILSYLYFPPDPQKEGNYIGQGSLVRWKLSGSQFIRL